MNLSRRSFKEVGRFQWCLLILFTLGGVPGYWGNVGVLFIAPKLNTFCRTNFSSLVEMNSTEKKVMMSAWPKCQKPEEEYWLKSYYNGSVSEVSWTKCEEIDFEEGAIFKWTVTQKYSLVCDREWLINFGNSVYMLGFFIAAITCGSLADRFGRKTVTILSNIVGVLAGALVSLAPNVEMYLIARFFQAVAEMGSFTAAYILVMELLRKDQRILALAFGGPIALLTGCMLPGVATILPNHEYFSYLLASMYLLFFCLNYFIYPESPRWLTSRKRFEASEQIVTWIAAFNKDDKENLHYLFQMDEEKKFNISPLDLLRTPLIRKRTIILWLLWFSCILINYGLLYNLADFGTDVRVTLVFLALLDFPGWVSFVYMSEKFGRQLSLFINMLMAGVCCLAMAPLVEDRTSVALSALALLGKTFSGNQFSLMYQHTPELYPTVMRTMGLGSSSTVARIGGMIAPLISLLNAYWPPMLVVLLGGITLLATGLVPLLPDTTGHELAQTIDEGEKFFADHGYKLVVPPGFECSCGMKRGPSTERDPNTERGPDTKEIELDNVTP